MRSPNVEMIESRCERFIGEMIESKCGLRSRSLRDRLIGEMIENKCDRYLKLKTGKPTTDKIPLQSIEEVKILLVLPTLLQYCTPQSR